MKLKKIRWITYLLCLQLFLSSCVANANPFVVSQVEFTMPTVRRVVVTEGSQSMTVNTTDKSVTAPYVKNGRMLVPLRAISEGLGAIVNWDEQTQSVSIAQNGKTVTVRIGSAQASDSVGVVYTLDVAPELFNGNTTMVPIRFVSEALGYEVTYDAVKKSAYIAARTFTDAPMEISDAKLEKIQNLITDKIRKTNVSVGSLFADMTDANGVYKPAKPGWTSGYLVSFNLVCYELTGESCYLNEARNVYNRLLDTIYVGDTKNVVFNLGFTSAMRYFDRYLKVRDVQTGDYDLTPLLDAANGLAAKQAEVGYLHPWGNAKKVTIDDYRMLADSMCSLGIFTTASQLSGDASYLERAKRHADLTLDVIVRDDYTTCHTFIFNQEGQPAFEQNKQGYANGSCWARGMAWVIAGMAEMYEDTGEVRYLDCAKRLIDTYLLKCEKDMIARWDLDFTGDESQEFDTSASAITACGMLDVYEATGDTFYLECAKRILNTLYDGYSSKDDVNCDAVLKHAVANRPSKIGVDVGLIYGDYFYAKLLQGYMGLNN